MSGYTHTAAVGGQVGSAGSGRIAFAASARTLPGVSIPSRVVRSTIPIARSIALRLDSVLIDRVPSEAARCSAPTWSTPGSPCRNRRSGALLAVSWANFWAKPVEPGEGAVAFSVVTPISLG